MLQRYICCTSLIALILGGGLGLSARSALAEGTVQKVASTADGYCHLKIPAARPSTLANEKPELKSSNADVIDYYGPCDIDPTGKDIIAPQKRLRTVKFGKF
jgi:hypothetical protein